MIKNMQSVTVLLLLLLFLGCGAAKAAGVITFHVEVLPGLSISSPELLEFEPVAPGQASLQEVGLTVWANVPWGLSVKAKHENVGLSGGLYYRDFYQIWVPLDERLHPIITQQDATGDAGLDVTIPFRYTGSYLDEPGTYAFEVEFTVVPAL